jgi:hypothetical protein
MFSRWLPLWPVAGGLSGVWAGWPSLSRVGSRGVGGVSGILALLPWRPLPRGAEELVPLRRPHCNGIFLLPGAAAHLSARPLSPVNIPITGCARASASGSVSTSHHRACELVSDRRLHMSHYCHIHGHVCHCTLPATVALLLGLLLSITTGSTTS